MIEQFSLISASTKRASVVLGSIVALSQLFVPLSVANADESGGDPVALINEMADSLKTLTYRGTFVHLFEDNVETMQILHANDNNGVRERMISLNGEAREVYRNNSLVTCIWPGSRSVIVSKSKPRNLLPKVSEALTRSEYYQFEAGSDDRVAGHETHVVNVIPKDEYRYGYRFWIEKETKMLLRSMLLDNNQKSLEQLMFTQISFPDSIPESELEANAKARGGYSWLEPTDKAPSKAADQERVAFEELPWGYTKVSETYRPMPMNDSAVSHAMLSDGMASISVYVEYLADPAKDAGSAGLSRMGAMNAYGRSLDSAFVTVVGEVPVATVKFIGDSVRLTGDKK